jgi:AcrR family transcriptional regulator
VPPAARTRHAAAATAAAAVAPASPVLPSPAQARIINAALDLFARNGVGGTSLQMIADQIGVTKAAVYHQFNTKDEIVLAAAEAELARLEAVLEDAEAETARKRSREILVRGIVDLAIRGRRTTSIILSDPVIIRFFATSPAFSDVMHRLRLVLIGDEAGPDARVRTAMLLAAISGSVMHPFVIDLDDSVLRAELLRLARTLLGPAR